MAHAFPGTSVPRLNVSTIPTHGEVVETNVARHVQTTTAIPFAPNNLVKMMDVIVKKDTYMIRIRTCVFFLRTAQNRANLTKGGHRA